MTPEQNALLARLDGYTDIKVNDELGIEIIYARKPGDEIRCRLGNYDDERNLMSLAEKFLCDFWKLDNLWYAEPCGDAELCSSKNLKEAIQQALLAIAREKYGE